jgi:hypothetical protein
MKLLTHVFPTVILAGVVSVSAAMGHPESLLAQARAAIGGAVAQQAVTSLELRGTHIRHVAGRTLQTSWQAFWEAPDKFVQVATQHSRRGAVATTRRSGFNGDAGINHVASDLPVPTMPQADPDQMIPHFKRELSRLLVPLLASVTPLEHTFPHAVDGADGAIVTFNRPDGTPMRLFLDPATSLPSIVTWMAYPIIVSSTTTVVTSRDGRPAPGQTTARPMPPLLPGPPSRVEHVMTLSDYRTDKGVRWPRRMTITVDGATVEELRLSGWTVNPKINPRRFAVPPR